MDKTLKKSKKTPSSLARREMDDEIGCIRFNHRNYLILGVAIVTIVLGFICLSMGRQSDFLGLTASAILLVVGYLVLVPWAILTGRAERRRRGVTEKES